MKRKIISTQSVHLYQSIGEYSCDEGYYLSGDTHTACQADQQWSAAEPSCIRKSDLLSSENNCHANFLM